MEDYLQAIVTRYTELESKLIGKKSILRRVGAPFIQEDTTKCKARAPGTFCPWCNRPFGGDDSPNPQAAPAVTSENESSVDDQKTKTK